MSVMQKLAAAFKLEFDTVRDLEQKGFRAFWICGGILGAGIILTLLAVTMPIGIPLMIIGALGFFFAIIWVTIQSREPTRRVFCPYCATSNEVYLSRSEFSCDICERRIAIGADGEPVALEDGEDD
jgi:hypothetical protein